MADNPSQFKLLINLFLVHQFIEKKLIFGHKIKRERTFANTPSKLVQKKQFKLFW